MSVELRRPVFIVGHPRSGTTLLASILGRHPRLAVTPETLYCRRILPCGSSQSGRLTFRRDDILKVAAADVRLRDLAINWDRIRELVPAGTVSHREVFAAILEAHRERAGKDRIIEKSPLHLAFGDLLLDWFPDAKIIVVERDGSAVVDSLSRVPWNRAWSPWNAIDWTLSIEKGRALAARHPDSVRIVRFEELVGSPGSVLESLASFIGETMDERLLVPGSSGAVPVWEREWKAKAEQPIDPSRAGLPPGGSRSWAKVLADFVIRDALMDYRARGREVTGAGTFLRFVRRGLTQLGRRAIRGREWVRVVWCRANLPLPPVLSGRRRMEKIAGAKEQPTLR